MTPAELDDLTEVICRYAAEAVGLPGYRRHEFYSIVRALTTASAKQARATEAQAKQIGEQMVEYIKMAVEVIETSDSGRTATA